MLCYVCRCACAPCWCSVGCPDCGCRPLPLDVPAFPGLDEDEEEEEDE